SSPGSSPPSDGSAARRRRHHARWSIVPRIAMIAPSADRPKRRRYDRSMEATRHNGAAGAGRVAVVTAGPGKLQIEPEENPVPAAGEIVVEAIATGVCGSDVHLFFGDHPYSNYPLVQGHETVGLVAELGTEVD